MQCPLAGPNLHELAIDKKSASSWISIWGAYVRPTKLRSRTSTLKLHIWVFPTYVGEGYGVKIFTTQSLEHHSSRWSPYMASFSSLFPRSLFLPNLSPMSTALLGLTASSARWVQFLWRIPIICLLLMMGIVYIPNLLTSARLAWHFCNLMIRRTCVLKVCPTSRRSSLFLCEAQPLRRRDIEINYGSNPSQASQVAVPCCVYIECGPQGEGTCLNTPDTEVNDCEGKLVESGLPLR